MKKAIVLGIAIIILAFAVTSAQAQDYPDPELYDWVCEGNYLGILCDKMGDDQANVFWGFPEGYCIELTLPGAIGDETQYYIYYMVPCEPTTPPEMPEEVQKWASDATEGSVHIDWLGTWTMGTETYVIFDEGEGKQSLWLNNQKIGYTNNGIDWEGVAPGQE